MNRKICDVTIGALPVDNEQGTVACGDDGVLLCLRSRSLLLSVGGRRSGG